MMYDQACGLAALGEATAAMERLAAAVAAGFADAQLMRDEPGLSSLYGPDFEALAQRAGPNPDKMPDDLAAGLILVRREH